MSIKSDSHALKALAEEVAVGHLCDLANKGGVGVDLSKMNDGEILDRLLCGPRVQDGASYFHGIWNDSRFASLSPRQPVKDD